MKKQLACSKTDREELKRATSEMATLRNELVGTVAQHEYTSALAEMTRIQGLAERTAKELADRYLHEFIDGPCINKESVGKENNT